MYIKSLLKSLVYVSYKYTNMKMQNILDNALTVLGVGWSLENINTALGIVLLVLNLIRILWRMSYKTYLAIKEKRFDDVEKSLNEGIDEVKELNNKEDKNE